jgi:hypothetical protein
MPVSTIIAPITASAQVIWCSAKNTGLHVRFSRNCRPNTARAMPRPRAPLAEATIASATPIIT